jgi:hypothetical protein
LFAPQHQQFGIGREDLAQSVLKGAAGFHAPANVVYPLQRNPFDPTLPLRHEREKPNRMTLARCAMTSGFATAAMSEGQRTRQEIFREGELSQATELALPEASRINAFGANVHLHAIMHTD